MKCLGKCSKIYESADNICIEYLLSLKMPLSIDSIKNILLYSQILMIAHLCTEITLFRLYHII